MKAIICVHVVVPMLVLLICIHFVLKHHLECLYLQCMCGGLVCFGQSFKLQIKNKRQRQKFKTRQAEAL